MGNTQRSLYHHGILGMKWGVRRYQNKDGTLTTAGRTRYGRSLMSKRRQKERDYQRKLAAITKNKNASYSDIKRVKNRQQHMAKRVGKAALRSTIPVLMNDIMSGKINPATYTNKAELAKRLATIGTMTFATVAKDQALAKSTASRYNSDGRKKPNANKIISKEDWIDAVTTAGIAMIPLMGYMGKGVEFAARHRARAQARVDSWGANILPQKVDNIIWQSPDLTMAIIDNRGR